MIFFLCLICSDTLSDAARARFRSLSRAYVTFDSQARFLLEYKRQRNHLSIQLTEWRNRVVSNVVLQLDEQPTMNDLSTIVDGVRVYNRAITGHERPRAVACFLRDDNGQIVGGAHGDLWGKSVHIAAMWVAESYRGKGHGSALLKAVEDYAASQGQLLSYLETTSFQARPFYESLGYYVFGELAGIAEGCTLFFLRKELT